MYKLGFTLINEGGGGTFSKMQHPLCILQHEVRGDMTWSIRASPRMVGSRDTTF
jgi:hypothetical protein